MKDSGGRRVYSEKRNAKETLTSNDRQDADKRMEKSGDEDLVIGRNPVLEALKSGRTIDKLFVEKNPSGSLVQIISYALERGVVVKEVSGQKLDGIAKGGAHQGVIASGACAEYKTVEEILEIAKNKGEEPFLVICDEIEDPHNLGAIIRTAECAGVHGVIIPKRRSASLNTTVFKTSAGAASLVPVARVANIVQTMEMLKQNGVWIYGTDAKGEDYRKVDFSGAVALVIGSEGKGISRLVREKCDFLLSIPLKGQITSLNASVAAGIFIYRAADFR